MQGCVIDSSNSRVDLYYYYLWLYDASLSTRTGHAFGASQHGRSEVWEKWLDHSTHQWPLHLSPELALEPSVWIDLQGSDQFPGGAPQWCSGSGPPEGVIGLGIGSAATVGIAGLFRV